MPVEEKLEEAVFSTYVEVILKSYLSGGKSISFLHVCGGDPGYDEDGVYKAKFSPRMWR